VERKPARTRIKRLVMRLKKMMVEQKEDINVSSVKRKEQQVLIHTNARECLYSWIRKS